MHRAHRAGGRGPAPGGGVPAGAAQGSVCAQAGARAAGRRPAAPPADNLAVSAHLDFDVNVARRAPDVGQQLAARAGPDGVALVLRVLLQHPVEQVINVPVVPPNLHRRPGCHRAAATLARA
jgi:hypothetical protein